MPFFKINKSKVKSLITNLSTPYSSNALSSSPENKVESSTLLPTEEIINISKKGGADFGSGNVNERIRYFVKLGLLPHAIRKLPVLPEGRPQLSNYQTTDLPSTPIGHLPYWCVERLIKITSLSKEGLTFPQIAQKIKKETLPGQVPPFEQETPKPITPDTLLPTQEVIELAKRGGANFGSGTADERIRYFIKLGLLTHAVRRTTDKSAGTIGHLPFSAIERLIEITSLNKTGLSFPQIAQKFKQEAQNIQILLPVTTEQLASKPAPTENEPQIVKVSLLNYPQNQDIEKTLKQHEQRIASFIDKKLNNQAQVAVTYNGQVDLVKNNQPKSVKFIAIVAIIFSLFSGTIFMGYNRYKSNSAEKSKLNQIAGDFANSGQVLAASSANHKLYIDADSEFSGTTLFKENITAPNIIYSVKAGTGIAVTPGQNPIVSLDTTAIVPSVNNASGPITLKGSGSTSITNSGGIITISSSSSTSGLTTEADTLATVTGRGATTATAASFTGGATVGTSLTLSPFTSDGGVLYTDASGLVKQVTAGIGSQCLLGGTTPSFGSCAAGGAMTSFTLAGDSGTNQTISDSNILTIAGGAGLTSTTSATDTITLAVGAGTGITVNANDVAISATYTGQTSITTLGTIITGVWNGTAIANANLANSTITFAADSGSSTTALGATRTIAGTSAQGISTSESIGTITITAANAAADGSTKGVAAFNSTNFSASTGVINTIQNINSSATPTFASQTLTSASNQLTLGTGVGTTGVLSWAVSGGNKAIAFPNETGTVCTTGSVCSGYQASGTFVTSVSGTTNRISSTGGTTPVIDIAATYVGQSSITTTGALTTGSIASGFGTIATANTISTSSNISTTGTGTITSAGLLTGSLGAAISGAATSINASSNFDTNVNTGTSTGTVTIGNSASTAIKLGKFATTNGVLYISDTVGTVAETAASTAPQCLTSASAGAVPAWGSCALGTTGVTSVAGTANQILANNTSGSAQTGDITLTLPSAITTPGSLTTTSGLTAGSGLTLTTGALSLTATSGSIAATGFGTTSFTSTTTTGNINQLTDISLAPAAAATANLLNLPFTNGSANTSGTAITAGINIAATNNAVGSGGTQETYAVRIQDIAGTSGAGTQNNYGIRVGNQGLASTELSYGLYIDTQSGSTANYGLVANGNVNLPALSASQLVLTDSNKNLVSATATAANTCSDCLIQVPLTTARNTITPTAASVVGLTVNGTSSTAATALSVIQGGDASAQTIASNNTTASTIFDIAGNGLTTGKALNISSTSANLTSGKLIAADHTATYTATTVDSGNIASLTRALTTNQGNITYDNASSSTAAPLTCPTNCFINWNHTVTGTNTILIVGVSSSQTPTSVTYNSVPMTYAGGYSGGTPHAEIYYLVAPTTGINAVQVNFASNFIAVAGAVSYTNVNQGGGSASVGTIASNSGSGSTASVPVTTVPGDLVVDTASVFNAGSAVTITPDGSQTQRWNTNATSLSNYITGGGSNITAISTGTSASPQWTWTGTKGWSQAALPIHPLKLAITGTLASLTSNCTVTTGVCTDSSNILGLTQSYASSTGAVLNVSNAGSGASIAAGNITSTATGTNTLVNLGNITSVASATSYGINLGTISGPGTATFGINLGANSSTATNNYGINIGATSGAGTNNYGVYIGSVTGGVTTNYALYAAAGKVNIQNLTANLGVYTDGTSNLTSTVPTAGILGYWQRNSGTSTLTTANASDNVTIDGALIANGTSTFNTDVDLTFAAGENIALTNTTATGTAGSLDLAVTSSVDGNKGINLAYTSTIGAATTDASSYGIYNTLSNTTVFSPASNAAESYVGVYTSSIHNAADTALGTLPSTLTYGTISTATSSGALNPGGLLATRAFGIYGSALNNATKAGGSTISGFAYGGYFNATTTTSLDTNSAFGVFSNTSGGDKNYNYYGAAIATAGTTNYGLYLGAISAATNNYAIYTAGGDVFHTLASGQQFHVTGTTIATGATFAKIDNTASPASIFNQTGTLLNLTTVSTESGNGVSQYGIFNSFTNDQIFAAPTVFSPTNFYGMYGNTAKTNADETGITATINTYGIYQVASNTGAIDGASFRNTMGVYSLAYGDTAGTSAAYGVYTSAYGAKTNYALYTTGGNISNTLTTSTAEKFLISATTNTGTAGVLDIDVTSATDLNSGINLSYTNSLATSATAYGSIIQTSLTGMVGNGVTQNTYGEFVKNSKVTTDGTTDGTSTQNMYGIYGGASYTDTSANGGDTSTRNIYAGYFTSTGDTDGTGNAIGIYATASGGDSNYTIYTGALTAGASNSSYQINLGTTAGATSATFGGINVGGISGAGTTSHGINVGANSATATDNYSVNIATLTSVGTNSYGLNIGGLTGASTTLKYGINVGAISGTTTSNYGLALGALTGGSTNNIQIQTGAITDTGTLNIGADIGGLSGTVNSSNNYGIRIGAISSAGTTSNNYGLYMGTVSGATNNYAAVFDDGLYKVDGSGNQLAANATATTNASTNASTTNGNTLSFASGPSFATDDVLYINNAGTDFWARCTANCNTTTITVSPNVSADNGAVVTKWTTQNIGATQASRTTDKRYFQGLFLGGVVTGDASTIYSDQNISFSDGATFKFTDGTNNLFSIADAGTTGNVTVTGTLTTNGAIASGLTPSSFVTTDGSGNLSVAALASSALTSALSDETGSGIAVFGTSPAITTSLTTGSTSFDLLNTTATTINFAGAATTALNIGNGSGNYTAINIGSGTGTHTINIAGTGATAADTINIGTGGTGADTINIGSSASTTALNFTSGTGSQTFASSVATTATTSSAFVFQDSALTSGTGIYGNFSATTGKGVDLAANSLTTGTAANITSTSANFTSGKILAADHTATYTTSGTDSGAIFNASRSITSSVGFDANSTGCRCNEITNATSFTWTHTLNSSLASTILVVTVQLQTNTNSVSSITYDPGGLNPTFSLVVAQDGPSGIGRVEIWKSTSFTGNSTGHTVTVNITANGGGETLMAGTATSWTGVNSVATKSGTNGSGASQPSHQITSGSSNFTIYQDAFSSPLAPLATVVTKGSTQQLLTGQTACGFQDTTQCLLGYSSSTQINTGQNPTFNMTWAEDAATNWAQAAVVITGNVTKPNLDLAVTGQVANISSTCSSTYGNCKDSGNILKLTQSYTSATGATLNISNLGLGTGITSATTNSAADQQASNIGLSNTWNSSTAWVGSGTPNVYGIFNTATKTGSDTASVTATMFGTYSTASYTGTGASMTRNTYGGYFTATGDANGTSNAYGIYAAGASADNSYGAWIVGNTMVDLNNSNSSTEAVCGTVSTESGTNSVLDDCTTSVNADYAEIYPTDNNLDYGDIAIIGPENIQTQHNAVNANKQVISIGNYSMPKLVKSSSPYQGGVIGIVSNNWSDFSSTGRSSVPDQYNPKPVALNGRVPVKVSTENGAVNPGDPLTTSSTSGVAMKADLTKGSIIGKALGSYSGNAIGEVLMFVEISSRYNLASALQNSNLQAQSFATSTNNTVIDTFGNITTAGNVTANGSITAAGGALTVDGLTGNIATTGSITAAALNITGDANIGGKLTANTLKTNTLEAPLGQDLSISLGDSIGSNKLKILDSIGNILFSINSNSAGTALALPNGYICVNNNGTCNITNPVNGTVYADNFSTAATADLAEHLPTKDSSIDAGDIVAADPTNPQNVIKSNSPYQNSLLGIISTAPGVTLNSTQVDGKPLALAGRVPVKVNLENGAIKTGDPITSSSVAGVGMKATKAGRVIGIALEDFDNDTQGTITVFVNPSWYTGTALASNGSFDTPSAVSHSASAEAITNGQSLIAIATNSDGTLTNPQTTQNTQAEASTKPTASNQPTIADIKQIVDKQVDDKIDSLIASGRLQPTSYQQVPNSDIASPTNAVLGESTSSAQASSSVAPEASTTAAIKAGAQITADTNTTLDKLGQLLSTVNLKLDTLSVTGSTNLANVQTAGTFSQDGTFVIDYGKQLNVLGSTLYLQNDPFAGDTQGVIVDIGNGKVTIDKLGNLTTLGTITARNIETKEITVNTSDENAKTVGSAQIISGKQSITIFTSALKPNAKVLITPTGPTGGKNLYVANKSDFEGFTVTLDGGITNKNIQFDWLIVNTTQISQK